MFVLQYSCIVTHITIYQPVVWDSIYLDQLPRTITTHLWFRRARRSFPPLFQASGICHTACLICSIRFRDDRQSTVFWYVWFDGFHNGPSLRERNFSRLELFSLSVHWMGLDSSRVERATFESCGKADHDDDAESDEADSAESDNGVPCEQTCQNVMLQHLSLDFDFLFLVGLRVSLFRFVFDVNVDVFVSLVTDWVQNLKDPDGFNETGCLFSFFWGSDYIRMLCKPTDMQQRSSDWHNFQGR